MAAHEGIAVLDGWGALGMCRLWLSFYDAFVRRMVGLTSSLLWLTFLLRMMAVVVVLDLTDCVGRLQRMSGAWCVRVCRIPALGSDDVPFMPPH